ncbi:MAG: hypothetical protein HYW89_01480 [Candidatus Sungiibacteriota bacterium]|uniref:Prepilin-type N-terminal cleavage/methylation domain-containing protein n=1 Tax=Candidatus Sungiibacteriota bacterium TaxID=2750080 RepID=A0A7T5RK38_9BACT|nr:MAG: hypothetical protein HYW89_01480 [Candidatus Sungbacteria bacterium]
MTLDLKSMIRINRQNKSPHLPSGVLDPAGRISTAPIHPRSKGSLTSQAAGILGRWGDKGLTLIEIIIYVALLGLLLVFVVNSFINTVNAYYRARAEREVLSNGRLLLETITKSLAQSGEIYSPTSRFNIDSGQLSLITVVGVQAGHAAAYVDYYVDNGRLWLRQEGQSAIPISAASVKINKFRLERLSQGLGREAVRMTVEVSYARPKFTSSISLTSTTALRGNY